MNIGIVGLGLIGGSLGLDLKSQPDCYVWGTSRSQETCKQAVSIGAVDAASQDLEVIPYIDETDVLVICTPIPAILPAIAAIAPRLSPTTIITDAGSVKSAIVAPAQKLWPRFIGSHPMAGTAFSGISAAERHLFQKRPCVVVPSADREAVVAVRSLWQSVGAVVYECDMEVHDRAVAWISHLPVVVSASLILACSQEGDGAIAQLAQQLASSGFRDTSRVGGGNPELGRLMAEYNQTAILKALHSYQEVLQKLTLQIESGQWANYEAALSMAQRDRLPYIENKP